MESTGRHGLVNYQIQWHGLLNSLVRHRIFLSIPIQSLLLSYLRIHRLREILRDAKKIGLD